MKKIMIAVGVITFVVLLVVLNQFGPDSTDVPLVCHVGGTMRPVITELAKKYQDKTGQAVEINSAGAHTLTLEIASNFTRTQPLFRSVMLVQVTQGK